LSAFHTGQERSQGGVHEGLQPKNGWTVGNGGVAVCLFQQCVCGPVLGQNKTTQTTKNYYSKNASRVEAGDKVMIIDYGSMMLYQLDPAEKTYSEVDFNQMMAGPAGQGQQAANKRQMFQKMMKSMMDSIQVTPTGEHKKIAGYDCHKVNVQMMTVSSEYWVSNDVPGYDELKQITAEAAQKFKDNPVLAQMTQTDMLTKLDGFPVQVISKMSNRTMTTTLQQVEQKTLSADLFKIPAGYTKVAHPGPPSQ
jgi:hypothetical protein